MSIKQTLTIADFSSNVGGIDIERGDLQSAVKVERPEQQHFEVKGISSIQYNVNPHGKRIKITCPFMRSSTVRRDLVLASETGTLGESGFLQLESGVRYILTELKITEIGAETGGVATDNSDAEEIVVMATGERA